MSNSDPQKDFEIKGSSPSVHLFLDDTSTIQVSKGFPQEQKSKDQLMEFCPPKNDLSDFLADYQMKKGETTEENEDCVSEKFSGPLEKPKTANKAFGSILDFLLFFENRNHEIKKFSKRFQEMEDLMKKDSELSLKVLNEEIAPGLCKSLKKMPVEFKNHSSPNISAPEENKEKDEAIQKLKKGFGPVIQKIKMQKAQNKEYVELFEKDFTGLEEFYKHVLYAYTINGVLYRRMNEYLRTEDWIKLDELLIYTYCLFKAYLWGPTGLTDADSFAYLKSRTENNKLTLYRRAGLDQLSLDFYLLGKIKEFSWGAVTSTSLLERATRRFAGNEPKKPVLIVIEVDFKDLEPESFNALYLAKLSKYPLEQEVALAPGSIFELLEINEENPEVEMRLRLITNAKILAHQGKFLHGMLQEVMRNEDELKLVCLKGKELSRAIKHCKGNQLVAKLEFSLCNFNAWSVKVLLDVLPTIKSLNSIIFNSVISETRCWDQILKCLEGLKIKQLEIINSLSYQNDIKSFISCIKYFGSLKILKLSLGENSCIDDLLIRELYSRVMQYLDPKCVFELNMTQNPDIVVKGLETSHYKQDFQNFLEKKWPIKSNYSKVEIGESYFSKLQDGEESTQILHAEQKGIKLTKERLEKKNEEKEDMNNESSPYQENSLHLIGTKQLFGYSLRDDPCLQTGTLLEAVEEKEIFSQLSVQDHIIAGKQSLETLNLNFEECKNLHDKDLQSLGCEGIQFFQSLTTLNLNFNKCKAITDRALGILSNSLIQKLTGLNHLHLSFEWCGKVTDEGLKILTCDGIQHLQSLTKLSLCFSGCKALTNAGLRSLTLKGIANIRFSLTSLSLNFEGCSKLTDEGLENLFHDNGFEFLTSLNLNFNYCFEMTDRGIEIISSKGLQKLKKSLKMLSLSFNGCYQITDEAVRVLSCEGVRYLESLTNLSLSFSLDFGWPSGITDQGVFNLFNEGKHGLSSLTVLHLNFDECQLITNEGLTSLSFSKELINLRLSFNGCKAITDDGLDNLAKEIGHLKSLNYLNLSFKNCEKITDNGLRLLCSQGIKPLRKLNVLHLRFGILQQAQCSSITDQSLKSIGSEGIRYLPELKILHLDVERCSKITSKGLEDLCKDGIQYLKKLTDLHLNFFGCRAITDEGLQILGCQGLFHLKNSLKTLDLNFDACQMISDVGLESLFSEGIRYLEQLTTLYLEFLILDKISKRQLLQPQYETHLLNLPLLQLPLEILWETDDWGIDSLSSQLSNSSKTAFVLCRDRLLFTLESSTEGLDEIQRQKVDNLTLEFEQGSDLTDSDITNSLFYPNLFKTFKALKTLHLTCDGCVLITDFVLHSLCCQGLQQLESLTSLYLNFNGCNRISDVGLESLGWIGVQPLKLLTSLSLSFNGCQLISDQGLRSLIDVNHLESLTSLHLSLNGCNRITDVGLESLVSTGIQPLKSLTGLSLSFNGCQFITTQGLRNLINIKHLECLDTLNLDFGFTTITDQGLIDLSRSGIRYLKALTSLSLKFDNCKITNRGLEELCDTGLEQLESLKFMHLSLRRCNKVTNKGLKRLYHQSMKPLTSFFIHFPDTEITERLKKQFSQSSSSFILISYVNSQLAGTSHFIRQKIGADQGLSKIQPMREESVEIVKNKMFTRYIGRNHYVFNAHYLEDSNHTYNKNSPVIHNTEDLDYILKSAEKDIIALILLSNIPEFEEKAKKLIHEQDGQEIQYLKSLTSLNLTLGRWTKVITDSIFDTLFLRVFQHLKSLTHLYMCFDGCARITYLGLKNLGPHGIRYLTSLTTLHLSFKNSIPIKDVGLKILSSEGIQSLKSLTTLHLDFDMCLGNLDEGLQNLWTDGILHLKSLTILELSFKCFWITGKGFKNLNEVECLKSLTTLRLNFEVCQNFKDEGVENLCIGLIQHLRGLTTLHLKFDANEKITDSSLQYLSSQGICHLKLLQNLHLSFARCWRITDLGALSLDLSSFKLLTSLYLNFDRCMNLTDQSLTNLTFNSMSLKILHLSFRGCSSAVTDQALEDFKIQYLTSLEALYLCFDGCEEITDEGIKALSKKKIQSLKLLKTLHLSFARCEEITEDGLNNLYQKGISHLSLLKNIKMCFFACRKISHAQLSLLKAKINLRPLEIIENTIFSESYVHNERFLSATLPSQKYLKRLNAGTNNHYYSFFKEDFYYRSKVNTNEMFRTLQKRQSSKIVDGKTSRFEDCFLATDLSLSRNYSSPSDKMENFKDFEALDNFKDIKMLQVEINNSEGIEYLDLKIKSLCRNILQCLRSLQILHITFEMPHDITDEELRTLGFEGISSLVGLTQLYLSFNRCHRITDQGLVVLSSGGLQNLKQLNVLCLNPLRSEDIKIEQRDGLLQIKVGVK